MKILMKKIEFSKKSQKSSLLKFKTKLRKKLKSFAVKSMRKCRNTILKLSSKSKASLVEKEKKFFYKLKENSTIMLQNLKIMMKSLLELAIKWAIYKKKFNLQQKMFKNCSKAKIKLRR